jgi:hypothetical protein
MNKLQMTIGLLAITSVVALSGCTINVGNTSIGTRKTGPAQTEKINVPMPADKSKVMDVEIAPAAANVTVKNNGESLVQGTVTYNVDVLKPVVTTSASKVTVRVGDVNGSLPRDIQNDWNLALGPGQPMNLTINTGASRGEWDLGGLALRNLAWHQGAADSTLNFSAANTEDMADFRFDTGAARFTARGLGNANFANGLGTFGAGEVILTFDGELSRDMNLTLDGGLAKLTIYSGGNPVRVTVSGAMHSTDAAGWTQDGKDYTSPEWANAGGSRINVNVKIGAGSVVLKTGK